MSSNRIFRQIKSFRTLRSLHIIDWSVYPCSRFGAANAYLGLIVGMTVSASIPAAVISMGIIRVILRKDSILENNLVQTIGSARRVCSGRRYVRSACIWAEEEGQLPKYDDDLSRCTFRRCPRNLLHGAASSGIDR